MKNKVSIITVNYNGLADTCELIESFRQHETYPYELIVVDNGSTLPEYKNIQERFPDVKVVQNTNTGFNGGNNKGLEIATGEYVFFINNDTLIKEPILESLVRRLKESDKGAVSPMIKYSYAPHIIQYAGYTPFTSITLRNKMIGEHEIDTGQYSIPRETSAIHGAAMMIRRDVLQLVAPITEVYFLFYEEFELSGAIQKAGYKLWFESSAIVYHKESMTSQRGTPTREFYLSRARILFARRTLVGCPRILSCLYILFFAAPKKSIAYLLHRRFSLARAVLQGTIRGIIMSCKDQ